MNFVNHIRILAAAFAMVFVSLTVSAADQPENAKAEVKRNQDQLDRLDLDATSVTGNQELPRVLYILPWKESAIGDLTGKPVNSLLDEVLAPLDREVFLRQVKYFDQLHANDSGHAAGQK
jgi:hypothetical protein